MKRTYKKPWTKVLFMKEVELMDTVSTPVVPDDGGGSSSETPPGGWTPGQANDLFLPPEEGHTGRSVWDE